jgi:hypothetical protein
MVLHAPIAPAERPSRLTDVNQQLYEVQVGIAKGRFQRNSALMVLDRFVLSTYVAERQRVITVSEGDIGILPDSISDERHRFAGALGLNGDHAEHMQRVEMIRFQGENVSVAAARILKKAVRLAGQATLQDFAYIGGLANRVAVFNEGR